MGVALGVCALLGAVAAAPGQGERGRPEATAAAAARTAWGGPVHGLQAGIRLVGGPSRVHVGDTVRLEVVLRNTTDHAVSFAWGRAQGIYGWSVRPTGRTEGEHVWQIAPRWRQMLVEHREPLVVAGALGMQVPAKSEASIPMDGPKLLVADRADTSGAATVVVGKPGGTIRLRALPVTAAARGEGWLDRLESGVLVLRVEAPERR